MKGSSGNATRLLAEWNRGSEEALAELVPLIQAELHRLARSFMSRERRNHTLQATALINEAFLRLIDQRVEWESRAHFVGVAARMMRRILVDYARRHSADKRGGGRTNLTFDEALGLPGRRSVDLLALDDALTDLACFAPRQAQIVQLRFFGGLTVEETAMFLDLSPATVKRDWTVARAWLHKELKRS